MHEPEMEGECIFKTAKQVLCLLKVSLKLAHALGLLSRIDFTANQIAGCGSVKPSEKSIITLTNCSEEKGAYCTSLSNGK